MIEVASDLAKKVVSIPLAKNFEFEFATGETFTVRQFPPYLIEKLRESNPELTPAQMESRIQDAMFQWCIPSFEMTEERQARIAEIKAIFDLDSIDPTSRLDYIKLVLFSSPSTIFNFTIWATGGDEIQEAMAKYSGILAR